MKTRVALVMLGVAAALILGVVQFASMALYGDLAQAPAVPALLPARLGISFAVWLGAPAAPVPLRSAAARALLHRGDVANATTIVAGLPGDADTADLRGQLAEIAGNLARALDAYAQAGDFERAQRLIDAQAASGQLAAAARMEELLVTVLAGDGRAAVRARALWRLGQLTQVQAAAAGAQRDERERASLTFYERALAIAPNEETYLLAAGQQALTLGDRAAAVRYYTRALESVPNSVDAQTGLTRARS